MKKSIAFFFSLVLVLSFAYFAYTSFGTPDTSAAIERPTLAWGAKVNPDQCADKVGGPVLNVTFKVTNDVDSGFGGYWAYDNNNKQVMVWKTSIPDQYCAIVRYEGQFSAVKGKTSPSGNGVIGSDFQGTFQGGYIGTITGKFEPGNKRVTGNLGTKAYGCDIENPTSSCKYFSWVKEYFPTGKFSYGWWGWIYQGGSHGVWVNSQDGSTGDLN